MSAASALGTMSQADSTVTSAVDVAQQPPATADIPKTSQTALAYMQSLVSVLEDFKNVIFDDNPTTVSIIVLLSSVFAFNARRRLQCQKTTSMPEDDFKYVMFDDNLVTVSDTGKELGEFTVTVEPTKFKGQECFLIHANSHGAIDGVPCGTSITCHVSKGLETLEQHHHEYVKLDNCPLDRKTIIMKQADSYVINRVITQGEDIQRTSRTIGLESMKGFISEGSNLLLHRIFIGKGLSEELQFISFDSETNICPAVYKSLEERTQTIEGVELRVFGVERTINSNVDLPTTWQSYFINDGHLSNRVQVGSPVTMKLQRLPTMVERDEEPPKPVFEKKELNWEEDMQMYSKFLDRKEELKGDHSVYMRHHPELKALLADFLQFLLLRKPDDVIAFAADYFAAFSSSMPTSSPFLASAAPTPFPASRTNTAIESLRGPTR